MLVLLALLFADPTAPSPSPAPPLSSTRVVLGLAATVSPASATYGDSTRTSTGARGAADLDATLYPWTPLTDDDAPRSLQPFLQRTSFVALDLGGQYLSDSYSPNAGGGGYTQEYVPTSASTRIFILPSIALLGALGLDYLHDERTPTASSPTTRGLWQPSGTLGLDARLGDASLVLQWQVAGVSGSALGPSAAPSPSVFPARVSLGGRAVIARAYDLTASIGVIPDGEDARLGLAAYPTKDLGLSLAAEYEHGQIYWESTTDYDFVRAGPSASYWVGPRAALSLTYTPQWIRSQTNQVTTTWQQLVTANLTLRLP